LAEFALCECFDEHQPKTVEAGIFMPGRLNPTELTVVIASSRQCCLYKLAVDAERATPVMHRAVNLAYSATALQYSRDTRSSS